MIFKKGFSIGVLFAITISIFGQHIDYDTSVMVGAERLSAYLPQLQNKKVALVGNQTSIVNNKHLVDVLLENKVQLVKVFAPEHGFRGTADAGEKVIDGKDEKTGLPVLSLYGKKNRKPDVQKLSDVDIVLFDLQDVGARFYTYISTLHYVMEACAEQNKKIIVLDRPNPNGFYMDGPILKIQHSSFIGMHPVPMIHGMTIGEYAQMINGEGWLANGNQCKIEVITCLNYDHNTFYHLPVSPSPNLPNMTSIYLYPSLCLFEGTNVSVGRGTDWPFQVFGSPFVPETTFSFVPHPSFGAKEPLHNGLKCNGVDLTEIDLQFLRSFKGVYLHWLIAMYEDTADKNSFFRKDGFFELLTGDAEIRKMITNGISAEEISTSWQEELNSFKPIRKKYLLYPDFE